MATFSVIIPVYNIENYLPKCIDSVLAQNYKDLEIILVDDGSKDNCPSICDDYASKDKRIQVIHKQNGGLVSARKAGAEKSTAEYIACVDGDDWLEPNYFEMFATAIQNYSPDIVCCGRISQSSNGMSSFQKMEEESGYYTKDDIINKLYPNLIGFSCNIWAKVFRRDIYMDVQLSVDDRIKMAEDACVVIPCVYRADSIYILENCLYDYRYNPSSMTKNKTVYSLEEPKMIAEHLEQLIKTDQDWFKQQIYESTVHRLFNRCVSQFYQNKSYKEICSILSDCLNDPFYVDCIAKSKFSFIRSSKNWMAKYMLMKRLYLIMRVYSKVR